jgi:hypothetical protein
MSLNVTLLNVTLLNVTLLNVGIAKRKSFKIRILQ